MHAGKPISTSQLTPYQRKLFLFLGVATFFEGYDFLALTQILPNLRADMQLSMAWSGYLVAIINSGTVLAYFLIRRADRWGRRRVLTLTIAGYTLFTFATGFAPDVVSFALLQLFARVFLIAEWATSMVIAAEEFPAHRRGMVIGVIQGFSTLGAIFCAGVVPLLLKTSYGWRSVYFVGVIPLILLAFARRGLKETKRFEEMKDRKRHSLFRIWRTPYRKRVIALASVWFFAYIASQNAVAFWKEFAMGERGMTDSEVGIAISVAAVLAMPLVFLSGKLIDVIGRRRGALVVFAVSSVGVYGCYALHDPLWLTAALVLGIFGASGFLPILDAYTSELFPTELRADAFAWSNNLLGRIGYVVSPLIVGQIAQQVGAFGPVVSMTAIFPIIAAALVWFLLPETRLRELEETSAL
ncbi:MAG: MFS transporter [Deltaproteobacteria bacterium]|nr:MFS transporter [Deltaproteobacteria bacterium]